MISSQKRITVHGPATHLNLTAFKFSGDEPLLDRAGFGKNDYIGIIRWGPSCALYFDNPKGYARSATHGDDDFVLNSAVQCILNNFSLIPNEAHLEVARDESVTISEGLQFK